MSNYGLTIFDVILGLVILSSGLVGFLRGFVREVLGIVAWIGAGFAVLYGLRWAKPFAREFVPWTWAADAVAAVVIFLVALVVLSVLSRTVGDVVRAALFGALDRSLGLLFGLTRGALVVSLAYFLVESFVVMADRPAWLQEARSLFLMERGAVLIRSMVPDDLASKARIATEAAAEQVRQMKEAEQTYHYLSNPLPVPKLTHRTPERLHSP